MTSNEIRQLIGMKPASDPNADVLKNKNMAPPVGAIPPMEEVPPEVPLPPEEEDIADIFREELENQNGN